MLFKGNRCCISRDYTIGDASIDTFSGSSNWSENFTNSYEEMINDDDVNAEGHAGQVRVSWDQLLRLNAIRSES